MTDVRNPIPTNGGDWVKKFSEIWTKQINRVQEQFTVAIESVKMPVIDPTDVPILYVKKDFIIEVLSFLKEELEYQFLSDITATDEEIDPRFEVVYNLFSHSTFSRIRLKVRLKENEAIPTACGVWPGANWAEREVYDMFGIHFSGHPDLRRILMDTRWQGHPLRKDYPLRGYQLFTEPMSIEPSLLE